MKTIILRLQKLYKKFLQALYNVNSLDDYDSPDQNQQVYDYSRLVVSNAIEKQYLDKQQISLSPPIEEKINTLHSSEFKTFLCSYNYEGKSWNVDIKATSLEDAKNRLRSLSCNGKVDGELFVSIPIPLNTNWVLKLKQFFS